MKKLIWLLKALVAGVVAVLVLSGFCLIYSYEGIHITEKSGSTDYVWESHQLKSTMKEGFAWLKMDENGYNNIVDNSKKPDILLMGSSHMEALQVDAEENTGALLNKILPEYRTYNIGISGHTIYRCVNNLEDAINQYNPKEYIVMVVDTVDLTIDEMEAVINGELKPIPSYDNGIMYYMQKIPAIKSIYKQLSDWISLKYETTTVNEQETDIDTVDGEVLEEYQHILESFLTYASDIAKNNNLKLMIVYQPMQALSKDGDLEYIYDRDKLELFRKVCREKNIIFDDIIDEFEDMYQKEKKLAHGFKNTDLGEGHLNEYGHKVIASSIKSKIKEMEGNQDVIN